MNGCTIEISPGVFKEGTICYFDIHTNRFFVEMNGEYHWYPRMQVCTKSDIKQLPGMNQSHHLESVSIIDRNDAVNSDSVLTVLQRAEYELLHPAIRKDMRRLEYEYFVSSSQNKRKLNKDRDQGREWSIPCSNTYHPYPRIDKQKSSSFRCIPTHHSTKKLSSRQNLLCWIYNHTNSWTKMLSASRPSIISNTMHIKEKYVKKHEKELYTMAFGLDEYGYYSLFPQFLLQDILSRVHNYNQYNKYSQMVECPEGFARVQIHHTNYYITTPEFVIGGITEEMFDDLKQMNPAISRVVTSIGGCDVSIVDSSLPMKVIKLFWSKENSQWMVRLMDPGLTIRIGETEYTINDGDIQLGKEEILHVNNNDILFATAVART